MPIPALRPSSTLSPSVPDGFSHSQGKDLIHRQNKEIANGIVTATRLHAAAYVAAVGVQSTAMLSREAVHQSGGDQITAARLHHIVDQLALVAAAEVARFAC
jgi:hypothetical protein